MLAYAAAVTLIALIVAVFVLFWDWVCKLARWGRP